MAHSARRGPGTLRGRISFRGVVAATTVLVLATVLLGVATKATGSGLACQARWPLCDGGFLDLFPQSFPSFFEWIHRVVAGVTGVAILATAWLAWRGDQPRRVRQAATLGLLLLPLQVLLGRETVLSFTLPVLTAHFWTAFAIFTAFVAATALAWRGSLSPAALRNALLVAALLVPVQVLLNPPVVTSYTPPVQTAVYLVTFLAFGLAVAAVLVGRRYLGAAAGAVLVGAVLAHPVVVFAGRHLFTPSAPALVGYLVLATLVTVGLVVAAVGFHRVAGADAAG